MAGSLKVKVCGIISVEQARLALDAGADYLGINLYGPSPRCVSRETAWQLCQYVPAGRRVLVDVNTATDLLGDYGDLGFDAFQIHCDLDTPLSSLAAWSGIVGPENLWLALRLPPDHPYPQAPLEFADTFVFDAFSPTQHGGTGRTADWGRLADLLLMFGHKEWWLAGGLNPENVAAAMRASGATHLDVNSGVEDRPGVKNAERLRAFFAAARGAA